MARFEMPGSGGEGGWKPWDDRELFPEAPEPGPRRALYILAIRTANLLDRVGFTEEAERMRDYSEILKERDLDQVEATDFSNLENGGRAVARYVFTRRRAGMSSDEIRKTIRDAIERRNRGEDPPPGPTKRF